MDPDEVPEGIDPKSACRVEVTVNSYFTVQDGRKEYNRGRLVSYVVDSEAYSILDLEMNISSKFKWDSDQKANFWVLTGKNVTCKLNSDPQLLDLLRAYSVVKLFMVVDRCENNAREEEMPTAVNIEVEEIPIAVNMGEEVIPDAMDTDLEVPGGGFTWAEIPEYGESTAGPPLDEEEEKEHFISGGCDPNRDEPAGADEGWREKEYEEEEDGHTYYEWEEEEALVAYEMREERAAKKAADEERC
ncbi:uncharacterized protein C2845_PM15G22880 [Panicum miliaceum]|uniref:Uncharacterized protein n=1 Tax=Panicum miliaceum TaxID=4540 RepID=A0A3L6QBE0_PANMI|nr:uncharacterized protein C2845_PM15G22880 [Panicum miliaceum]